MLAYLPEKSAAEPLRELDSVARGRGFAAVAQTGSTRYDLSAGAPPRGEASSLQEFLRWGIRKYPARRYAVIASGATPAELATALREASRVAGGPISLVSLEDPYAQRVETAYELRDSVEVLTGSPGPAAGHVPLKRLFSWIAADRGASPGEVGAWVVDAHRQLAPKQMHSALDLKAIEEAGKAVGTLVTALLEQRVDPAIVYTHMLSAGSIEPESPDSDRFDLRDLTGFLESLSEDPRISSARVREAAAAARQALGSAILDMHQSAHDERTRHNHGLLAYMPWKNPAPLEDDFARDARWSDLLAYVFSGSSAAVADPVPAGSRRGVGEVAARTLLRAYKKYVSPYLMSGCPQTPSCSQYTREAIELHGLVEGVKYGVMRFITCQGDLSPRLDPVPGSHPHDHAHEQKRTQDVLLQPPPVVHKGWLRRTAEGALVTAAGLAGSVAGGLLAGAAGLLAGAGLGVATGVRAGSGTLETFHQGLRTRYSEKSVEALSELEKPLATPAAAVRSRAGGLFAVPLGAVTGGILGALGGAWIAGKRGATWGGLMGRNWVKDKLGELPADPYTEAILQKDYA